MKFFVKIFCLIILLSLTIMIHSFARAGGGDSGYSGGGDYSSWGDGYSSWDSDYYSSEGSSGFYSEMMIILLLFGLLAPIGILLIIIIANQHYMVRTYNLKVKFKVKILKGDSSKWDWERIQAHLEKSYFEIQNCWKQENPLLAKSYLSEKLLQDFIDKINQMQQCNEKPVQENVSLWLARPVAINLSKHDEGNVMWVFIAGSMIGYYINKDSGEVVKGRTEREPFIEYWKFIYEDEQWVLDEILQKDDTWLSAL